MMGAPIKPLLLVNKIYDEFFFQEEAFVIYEDKLELFYHSDDPQSGGYGNTHAVVKFSEKTKQLTKKYLRALKNYIHVKDNQIEITQLTNCSEKFIYALEADQEIDSIKSALALSKDAPAFETNAFAYFLRAIAPTDCLPKYVSMLVKEKSYEEIIKKLDSFLL